MKMSFKVKMHCGSCEKIVEMAVGDLPGVKHVKADSKSGNVAVDFGTPATESSIKAAIIAEGYPVSG
ncbi:MAG: heavy-metal-associated domain-containing protein [Candidatus Micrarchaeia archaeon]